MEVFSLCFKYRIIQKYECKRVKLIILNYDYICFREIYTVDMQFRLNLLVK